MKKLHGIGLVAVATSTLLALPVNAVEYDYGGYLSVVAGNILDGDKQNSYLNDVLEYDCPCFIADYTDVGIYEDDGVSFKPDSGYGFNGQISFTDWYSVAGQVEGKGGNDFDPVVTWLYMRFEVTNNLSIDLGRKALPLYYYSDFINVSYAYPWIRASGDIYGWPLSSYNGISASYTDDLGDGTYTVSAWYGEEEDDDNRAYNDIYWGSESFYIKWSDIVGGAFEYSYDWIVLRAVLMTSKDTEIADWGGGDKELVSDNVKQNFYGLAAIIDYNDFLFQSEYNQFDSEDFESEAYLFAAGYRIGDFTPMITYSKYSDEDPDFGKQINSTMSYTLRWDFYKQTALTLQYDVLSDDTTWYEDTDEDGNDEEYSFTGDARVIALGVDYVF